MIDQREWLEPDGLGGFTSGTASGVRTRRYHGLLSPATTPPTGRLMLVNGFDAWVGIDGDRVAVSSQRYEPDVVWPDGVSRLIRFEHEPWPQWTYDLGDDLRLVQETVVARGTPPVTLVRWRLEGHVRPARLEVTPLLSGRDYHATHHENDVADLSSLVDGPRVVWQPYRELPAVISLTNGTWTSAPDWFRRFLYSAEADRGLDASEDLAAPGHFTWDLEREDAVWVLQAGGVGHVDRQEDGHVRPRDASDVVALAIRLAGCERERRTRFASALLRHADDYVVARGSGHTIVAGYPWFTDWGRDTFIALRGLCLATGRLEIARNILVEWSAAVSEGMLPNRFADAGDTAEFNSVDASLWFVVAAGEYLAAGEASTSLAAEDRDRLGHAIDAILDGYSRGTRFGIRADDDGLLAAGVPGVQLTWMDAKVGDWVVTPRVGKPVEVQALWLNALAVGSGLSDRWREPFDRGSEAFRTRFWNPDGGQLFDVVDVDHEPGRNDATLRPNQIFAVGGLPRALLDGERAARVVEVVEWHLLTPMGLRSLAPASPGYAARYEGDARQRDAAYHEGTVWPWLLGPFVDAWLRVRGGTLEAREEARVRFLAPLERHLDEAGLGHVSEIADAEAPFTPRGCPFQAWSMGELLRIRAMLGT